jgi:hypothetical protein
VTRPSPQLLPPGARPGFVGTLAVPGDLWWVCTDPTPLAGMAYPRHGAWAALAARGVRHVVDLTGDVSKYDPSPLTAHAFRLADLVVRPRPPDAEGDEARIVAAAALVADRWAAGEGVVVHRHAGRGRTGAVIGNALVRLGNEPDAVVDWIHGVQRTRGRRGWPEQAWQAEVVRRAALRSDPAG